MNIPSYEETICIYCSHYDTCSRNQYRMKTVHVADFHHEMKTYTCTNYKFALKESEEN